MTTSKSTTPDNTSAEEHTTTSTEPNDGLTASLTPEGKEILNQTPVAIPARIKRLDTEAERMKAFIEDHWSKKMMAEGMESIDEANDFDVDDEEEVKSVHELDQDQEDADYEFQQIQRLHRARRDRSAVAEKNDASEHDGGKKKKDVGSDKGLQKGRKRTAPDQRNTRQENEPDETDTD